MQRHSDLDLTFELTVVTLALKLLSGALVIQGLCLGHGDSDSDDHFNSGPMSLGPFPSGI